MSRAAEFVQLISRFRYPEINDVWSPVSRLRLEIVASKDTSATQHGDSRNNLRIRLDSRRYRKSKYRGILTLKVTNRSVSQCAAAYTIIVLRNGASSG